MSVDLKCIYCSCACNKTPNAIDWGYNNLICYAACNAIHLYKGSSAPTHLQTLTFHKKLVTSVHWINNNNEPETEFIATSADHTASIWSLKDSLFSLSSSLTGHTNVVRNGSAIYLQRDGFQNLLVVTLSIDCSIKVWVRKDGSEVLCTQTISLGNGFGLDAKFAVLKDSNEVILLVGADDSNVHIYVQDSNNKVFSPAIQLKGHQDWVQNIEVIPESDSAITIASASQDSNIRIWKISNSKEITSKVNEKELKVDSVTFSAATGVKYSVTLESVLSGHENWIYSARWLKFKNNLHILSSSMDKTVILWEYDANSNIWLEKVRLGEVGGNTLGFYGAVFSTQENIIIAHGYQGAIHIWKLNEDNDSWLPGLSFGGHYSSVQDINWDLNGEYLLSCSSDQTTRLHSPYVKGQEQKNWYELARPQIHGYDMVCLNVLNRFKYVSAGDEKVLRVFEAPRSFGDMLINLTNLNLSDFINNKLAEGASVPSLGLSNKAVFEEDIIKSHNTIQETNSKKNFKEQFPDFYYTPTHLTEPPTEETLLQNTLWPETQKLYGHPYEVFTVTSNHSKSLVASACKASKVEHAGIILWCTSSWKQVSYLSFHALTVTQIEFSPNDQYLLSVSRDRMWAIYKHFPEDPSIYRKIANLDRKLGVHARIIWSCSWTFDSLYFATASRDKKVAVWTKNTQVVEEDTFSLCSQLLEVEDSATAISFAPCQIKEKYIMAIGLENGCIVISLWCSLSNWNILHKLDQNIAHHLSVNKLRFSPVLGEAGSTKRDSDVLQLASCSNDHHVKIYNIKILSIT